MKQGSEIYHGKIERDKIQLKLSIAIFFFFRKTCRLQSLL